MSPAESSDKADVRILEIRAGRDSEAQEEKALERTKPKRGLTYWL
jgi:hypothetical protein